MKLNKSLLLLALLSVLSACGGSSSSKTPVKVPTPTPAPAPIQTTIEGKAIKGIMSQAIVTIYKYVDGVATILEGDELSEASIITQEDGSYSITINDYEGPIKVELSVGENTTMICDAPIGCGEISFGSPIPLSTIDPNLTLLAITSVGTENNGNTIVNVSALTHLSAALIEADEDGVNADSIQEQSSIIANSFNLSGNLTQLEPTTVDNPTAVASEDNFAELRYGLINSGIMSALFSGHSASENVLSGNLTNAVNDLVANDGALLVNQDENVEGFELSLIDVLDGASAAANAAAVAIAADPELAGNAEILAQLEQEETNLENQAEFAATNAGENGRVDPVSEQPTQGDAIAKAKAMVNDIRLFTHLFEIDTESNSAIAGEGALYLSLINDAGVMVEAEAASFLLLAEVADAITQLSIMYEAGTLTGTEFPINEYLSLEGAEGIVTFDEETSNGGMLFTINATSGSEIINLSIEAIIAEDGKNVNLNLSGAIESASAKLALAEGSIAKVTLDSVINRASLEDDSFDGEIVSGALELTLTLEQKATDGVTNPVKFTGLVKTKLIPVSVASLSVEGGWDDNSQSENYSFTPRVETIILPEMLTLSGGFSSAQGNLIQATLTAKIKDLESYQAPDFKYIGKKVESLANISFSDDKNTIVITESDQVSKEQQSTETRIYTPGAQIGEWSATSSVAAAFPDEHYWGTGIERKIITKRFDSGITEQGVTYTRAYVTGEAENNFGVRSVRITPKDHNDDNLTDSYQIDVLGTWDDKEYDGTSLSTLMDDNGNVLTSDGNVHPWDTAWFTGEHASIDQFMRDYNYLLIANPLTVSNGAELLAQTISNWWQNQRSVSYDDIGVVTTFFSEEDLVAIANGPEGDLALDTYLTKPLLKDAFTVNVSADSNTVIVKDATVTRTFNVDYTSEGNFVFDRQVSNRGEIEIHDNRSFRTIDSGLDIPEIIMLRTYTYDDTYYLLVRTIPVDTDGDNFADHFDRAITYSDFIDSDGVLVDESGNPITENRYFQSDAYADTFGDWAIPFDVLAVENGLQAYKNWLTNIRGSMLYTYIDDIGNVDVELSESEIASLIAGETTAFDAYVTYPAATESLENKDVFLGINAALSLETTLGDYQVNLKLSGDRTGFDDGKLTIDMQYMLPGDDAMRKFSVHMKTDKVGRLTANNSEGVLIVLKEPVDGSDSNVIGTIVVGASAEKVADIEDRDGIIMIVYSDSTTETL